MRFKRSQATFESALLHPLSSCCFNFCFVNQQAQLFTLLNKQAKLLVNFIKTGETS